MEVLTAAPEGNMIDATLSLLRENGGRITRTRRLLLDVLFSNSDHRTAEEIAAEIRGVSPDVHLSTIYRNLDELERLGVVVHAHIGHGPATYHLATSSHAHLLCDSCGAIEEVEQKLIANFQSDVRRHYGFSIDACHFAMSGQCKSCTGNQSIS